MHSPPRTGKPPAHLVPDTAPDGMIVSAWLTDLRFSWDEAITGLRTRRFAKDETLFLEGDPADEVYAIMEGRIRLTTYAFDGKERHLMIIGPNGLVGDCGLLSAKGYVVSAVAAVDAVVCAIPTSSMPDMLMRHPQLSRQHQQLSSMRFRIMLQHLALQGSNSARRRVCHHLLGLMNSYGEPHRDGTVISIAFTQQEMGNICGLSRVSVSNVFTLLEREGVITRSGRLIVICDAERLVEMSKS
jgi:CRP/FNR family cyclic AMP-dependent transcriptional regulator